MDAWHHCLCRFLKKREGSINIVAAISAPVVLSMAAFGIDYGNLILAKRALQENADLAAIVGVSDIDNAAAVVLGHLERNNITYAVRDGSKMMTKDGIRDFDESTAFSRYGGYAELSKGHYTPDAAISPDKRFVANTIPQDALKVTMRQAPELFFPGIFGNEPRLGAASTASIGKVATVAVSSRLASLNGGVVNKILSALTGTTISLSVMDSQALVDADIDVLALVDQLAMDFDLQAGTYDQLLAADVAFPRIISALSKLPKSATAVTALNRLSQQSSKSKAKFQLRELINLGPYANRRVGSIRGLVLKAGLMEIISAAANIANAGHQVVVDLDGQVPGLASADLTLLIGEPEVEAPYYALARPGGAVRTAQTRLRLLVEVNGLLALLGLKIKLPIYLDLAKAEAKIAALNCSTGLSVATGSAVLSVKPTLAEITLGDVDDAAFFLFEATKVSAVPIVDTLLLRVRAKSRVNATNSQPTTLKFSAHDIDTGKVKTVSTSELIESLTASLLSTLTLDIQILNFTLGTPQAITNALGQTLGAAVKPIDEVLANTLALAGVSVGEANVRVGSTICQRPVLVN